jgi:uncharacterized Zn finger protein
MAWRDYDDDDRFWRYQQPSRPLPAKGGIKARSKRGGFSESWWGQRWITVLESFGLGGRLTRGRSYARGGQVVNLEIADAMVSASVQGSRPNPYKVKIALKKIDGAQQKKLGAALAADMSIAARLVGGALPPAVEQCFTNAGVPLFPQRINDLKTSCSCPDSSNPCKHIAAVYYLIAEEFDRDPFLLLALRGISRDQFMALLGAAGSKHPLGDDGEGRAEPVVEPEPLAADSQRFWHGGPTPDQRYRDFAPGDEAAPLARRLGPFPFWRGETDFLDEVGRLSRQAAARALEVLARKAE